MKKKTLLAVVVSLAAGLSAYAADATVAPPALEQVAPDVVAVVNNQPLTRDQLAALAVGIYGRQVLEVIISQEVVRQEAARRGVTITDEELSAYTRKRVQEQLDSMARNMGAKDAADLTAKVGQTPATLEGIRHRAEEALKPFVGPELLAAKMIAAEVAVSDDDVRAEFAKRHGPKAKVLQIVLRTRPEAESVLAKLQQGADFRQLAQEISQDKVTRRQGGEMPPLPQDSVLGEAAFRLKPGDLSDVVETPDGFHVLKLLEIVPADDSRFEDVRNALWDEILQQRILEKRDAWVSNLVKKAEVTRLFQAGVAP